MKFVYVYFILYHLVNIAIASTCEINIPKILIVIDSNKNGISSNYQSTCPRDLLKTFLKLSSDFKGDVKISYILKIFRDRFSSIKPIFNHKIIKVVKIKKLILNKLNLNEDLRLSNITSLGQIGFFLIDNIEDVVIKKFSHRLGKKNIKIIIHKTGKSFWLIGKLSQEIIAYYAKLSLPFGSKNLTSNDFKMKKIFTDKPELYIIPIKKINFFKTVKAIPKNSPLLTTHVGSPLRSNFF